MWFFPVCGAPSDALVDICTVNGTFTLAPLDGDVIESACPPPPPLLAEAPPQAAARSPNAARMAILPLSLPMIFPSFRAKAALDLRLQLREVIRVMVAKGSFESPLGD